MKKTFFALISLFCLSFVFVSCGPSYNSIKRMQKMEEGVGNPVTKEELSEAIKKYDERALDLVTTQAQEGMWYKILGTRYLDERMYGKALECFQRAIEFYPMNANLYYHVAVCAVYIANSQLDYSASGGAEASLKSGNYLKLSEKAYLRALEIDPKYYKAMYGIGVLYAFQTGEYEKGIPYLEKFLTVQTKDTNGMFVLARCYFATGEFQKAIDLYDKIIEIKPNSEKVSEAEANKKVCLDYMQN